MTDYELLSVFQEFINITWTIFATYVSIVFAFIVASYLVSSRLTPRVAALVITLYTLVAFWSVWGIRQNATGIAATVGEIKRGVLEGNSSLGWVPIVETSDAMLLMTPFLITLVSSVAYVGSIIFFFYQRRVERPNQKRE